MPQPSGIHARRAALQMLDAVLRRGETLEQAEHAALRQVRKPADKGLALAIANEVLRWLTDLDALIDSATKQRLPDDAKPRAVLRMMLAQWLRLETPPHAVIATALPLLAGGPRRLAHGVFSTLTKREVTLPDVPTLPDTARARWGAEHAAEIASGLAEPPPLDLTLRAEAETQQMAVQLSADSLAPGHLRLARGEAVEKIAGFAEGQWWVQDLAASLPARMLGAGQGRHALDLCAAPGGKTLQLAATGWNVTALDISKRRLGLLKENLKRTNLKASPLRADALTWEPKHQFDAILLDAPCTATGTCRRHPDVLHRIGPRQIKEMVELQRGLVTRATEWLKRGGVLLYVVCSLEREEGEAQAEWIDAALGLQPSPIAADELPAGLQPTEQGWLRTHPGMLSEYSGLDGFFVARWIKT
ncbi:RsmB/NOP family class I SAM-dependent RNA methyltransferase [Altererythrobacter sp.]|uniref:RsmB/NOP family class I SAM-dependent RNA methyltransferase n=1 Tax=Altererythrobacter sp. TaxID=1872480 RepID=UPI001B0163C1|nr:RsmB/NOP family class I SAM-dependent RNA methyltransferase [Altererythrobacter sp.]MBO6609315.1 RsmB/NOP family class I SAM-dependent RNA methyltransferase [Altererythrobacter sp.]MBO6640684.1 RsmB/NOP family class I SAM-dependent RNA methyltransferase [Altererythrobacter sp.]MBO6708618.1 RsmB/NOP family class I SAM-dependent RNA methyltransferase [Altererythrobacter sp.]